MTRTFKTPEELMIALLQGEKWTISHITGVCSFGKDKVPNFNPFRYKTDKTDFAISAELYTHCDGRTLWTKVDEKTELDLMKEKYASGNYICLIKTIADDYGITYQPTWNRVFEYKLIHKKHKDILDAYLVDNSVEIGFNSKDTLWFSADFINEYDEILEYKLKHKKKTVSLAMFTCYDSRYDTWLPKEVCSTLDSFINKHNYNFYKNHHEIPNTRYEQEIDDA